MKKYIYLLFAVLLFVTVSCQQDEIVSGGTNDSVILTYSVGVASDDAATRAIGDGQSIDQLLVGVFFGENLVGIHTFENRTTEGKFTISVPLLRGKQYTLAFWAHDKDNTAYTIDETTMQVTVDYSKYSSKSLEDTEAFEAFSAIRTVTVSQNVTDGGNLSLTRPFAQVNVAAADEDIYNKVKRAELKLTNLPTMFNPLTGAVSGNETRTFTFTDFSVAEGDKLTTSGEEAASYTYLATVWALPTTSSITVNLYDTEEGGNTVREELSFDNVALRANYRLNIVGNMIQQQTMQAWDGVTFTDPARADKEPTCTVTLTDMPRAEGKVLHIETPDELAYILKEGVPTGYTHVHICNNLNMGGHDCGNLQGEVKSFTPANLPAGTLVSGIAKDGTSVFTISNITMNGNGATGLFGDTQELTVKSLAFDNIQMANTSATGGVGLLTGTTKGNLAVQNVTVSNSSVSASAGKAGGLVGYIRRIKETTASDVRTETLQADFTGCTLTSTSVSGAVSGKLVGELSGYDNGEVLNFTNCSATTVTGITSTDFCNARKSCFIETSLTEDHLLGRETYCRGKVNFDGNRFIPKWDGVRKDIVPLVENNINMIYSPYDVAYYQKGKPTSVTFKENVDLGSHLFAPIYSIKTLDGGSKTVYNLKVSLEKHDGVGAAFIQTVPSGVVVSHKNITLVGADVKNVHDTSLYPAYAVTNDGGAGNAYGGIFISKANSCTSYTIDNVHVKDSKLYAVCKMGGVIGQSVSTKLYMSNCSVDNCTIQNYRPNVPNYYVLGDDKTPWTTRAGFYVNLLQWWYTNGEAGGLIGFLQDYDADIDNCSVTNCKINCVGQPDKNVIANVYSNSQFNSKTPWSTSVKVSAKGQTTIAGRHVNQFIGDVVSYRSASDGTDYTVDITNYMVSGNSYNGTAASNTNAYNHQYDKTGDDYGTDNNLYCEVVGSCYYIGLDLVIANLINFGHMKYYAGEINFSSKDGKTKGYITEAVGDDNDIAWTGGNFGITAINITGLLKVYAEYPSEPARKDPVY